MRSINQSGRSLTRPGIVITAAACFLLFILSGISASATVYYADAAMPNNAGTGASWATAKKDVQAAINAASSGDQVWVKAGTYHPTLDPFDNDSPADARDLTFYIKSGVSVYGGFTGTETTLSMRNVSVNVCILDGNNGGTGTVSYHVVLMPTSTGSTIDGFTIRNGNANGVGSVPVGIATIRRNCGGGVYSAVSTNIIANNIITGNTTNINDNSSFGGGAYVATGSVSFIGSTLADNTACGGGGICVNGGSVSIAHCIVSGNAAVAPVQSAIGGGGLYFVNTASASITHTVIENNIAGTNTTNSGCGGGLEMNSIGTVTVSNSVFTGNQTLAAATMNTFGGGAAGVFNGTLNMTNCTFNDNYTNGTNGSDVTNAHAFAIRGGTTNLGNCIIWSTTTPAYAAGHQLIGNASGTLNINSCDIYTPSGAGSTVNTAISTYGITNYAGTSITTDPLFIHASNPAGPDGSWLTADDGLALTACSPAINTGNTPAPALPADILGNARSGIYDMGAYENQNPIVSIISQPINAIACEGSNTSFSITATGPGLTYQWQQSTDGGNTWNNLVASDTYTSVTAFICGINAVAASMNNNQYRCAVTGCNIVYSNAAMLTVRSIPHVSYSALPLSFIINTAIAPLIPVNTGAAVSSFYTISPAMPDGLTLNPVTGAISGTPTLAVPSTLYTIGAQAISGCSNSSSIRFRTDSAIRSVETVGTKNTVLVYPNPVGGLLTVKASAEDLRQLKIFNIAGQELSFMIRKVDINYGSMVLDVSGLTTGTYIIKTAGAVTKVLKR